MIDRKVGNKGGLPTTGQAGLAVVTRLGPNHRSLHRCLRQQHLSARSPPFQCRAIGEKFWDRQPVGKQGHQLFREVQPTEWSGRQSLAGRPIEDIRAWELSHKGLSELSCRLLCAGRYKGIVGTRSASEAVFTTQLLKRTREVDPDTKFMQKLSSDLVDHVKAKMPANPSSEEAEP